jgi:hypothetical protein
MGDTRRTETPDLHGNPAGGTSDTEASGSGGDEGLMETDLIDFEEERDQHPDETILDGDSEDEPGSERTNANYQDKSAVKAILEKNDNLKKKPLLDGKHTGGGDGVAHVSVEVQDGKKHKLPPSAPAPRDKTTSTEKPGGGGL